MRKRKEQTKLSRSKSHRQALLRNLSQELIRHGKIRTTLAKAKALRPFVEPLITRAKQGGPHAERLLLKVFYDREVVGMLMNDIGKKFANRDGGYTRIIKLGQRSGDAVEEAVIQLVGSETKEEPKNKNTKTTK